MSYSRSFPSQLYFFCLTPAVEGGETTLGDSRNIIRKIDAEVVNVFKDKGILYIRNLAADEPGYSWKDAFETGSMTEVERRCHAIGAEASWNPDGSLEVRQMGPAAIVHPETGEECWFNQAHGFHPSALDDETREYFLSNNRKFRLDCTFADGSAIPVDCLTHIRSVLAAETIPHRWQRSDVLILDNIQIAHGRRPFEGPRKIALSMI